MEHTAREAEALLPLTPAIFAILVTLADGERHGYGIMREVAMRGGTTRLGPGTLYRSINRMLADGMIEEAGEHTDAEAPDDERRRYYRLTPFGRLVAEAEAQRLARLVGLAREKRLLPELRPAPGGA